MSSSVFAAGASEVVERDMTDPRREPWRRLLLVVLVLLATGCSPAGVPPIAVGASSAGVPATASPVTASVGTPSATAVSRPVALGSSERWVTVAGRNRQYRVYRPARLPAKAPLVLVFHGYSMSAAQVEQSFGWDQLADAEGFLVVYPQGLDGGFNAGGCCGTSSVTNVDDVGATLAMVDDVAAQVPLDAARLHVTGFSNGGALAYRLACETDRFAAFGPVAGGLVVDCPDAAPTSILHIHGLADPVVPFDGGTVVWQTPVTNVLADWRARDQCAAPAISDTGRTHLSAATCPAGREVDLLTIDGLQHAWPTKADGVDATATLWAFFKRHPRGG